METSNLKNMVVLKSLPSNIVEEAIIILRKNIKVKELEPQNKAETKNKKNIKNDANRQKDYIVKEAEMLVNNYISKIENNQKKELLNKKINDKYKKMKKCLYSVSGIAILEMILLIIK